MSATSPNPLQNKVIFTEIQHLRNDIDANSTASQDADKELRDAIDANSNALGSLGIEVQGLHDAIDACQDTDKQLRKDIGINSTAISRLDGEIRGIHDDITACQDAHAQLREDIHIDSVAIARIDGELHTLATTVRTHSAEISRIDGEIQDLHDGITACQDADKGLRNDIDANSAEISRLDGEFQGLRTDVRTHTAAISRLQNENILSDFEDITISGNPPAPTRMKYDGYVTVIENGVESGVQLYINGIQIARATRHYAVTVFVAKNDDLYLKDSSSNGTVAYARFYKLRDYSNRPSKA